MPDNFTFFFNLVALGKYISIFCLFMAAVLQLPGQPLDIGKWPAEKRLIFFNDRVLTLQSDTMPGLHALPELFASGKAIAEFKESIVYADYNSKYYAHQFVICNSSKTDQEVTCLFGGRAVRLAIIGQLHHGKWSRIMTNGYSVPFEKRPFQSVRYGFPVRVPAGSCDTFYLSVDETAAFRVVGFILAKSETRNNWLNSYYLAMGWILGLLSISLLLNIYLFISLKEGVNGWYSLYLLFAIAFILKFEGLDAEFLGLDSAAGFFYTPMPFFSHISIAFLIKTIVVFAPDDKYWNRWKRTGNLLFVIILSTTIFFYIGQVTGLFSQAPRLPHPILLFCSITGISFIMALCTMLCLKRVSGAIIILAGLILVLLGALLRVFLIDGDFDVMPPFLFEKGLALEAIIISFGLMYRYNLFKKEKEALAISLKEQEMENTKQLIETLENEQERVARDLHDELSGNLAALQVLVHAGSLPPNEKANIEEVLSNAAQSARQIAHNLMPPALEHTGLKQLLSSYFNQLLQKSHLQFHFFYAPDVPELPQRKALMVYRMLLEMVNNILRHSQATEASVQINASEGFFHLVVEDNGTGIPANSVPGLGMRNLRTRVTYLGGTMEVDSSGKGTTIIISFPLDKNDIDHEKNDHHTG